MNLPLFIVDSFSTDAPFSGNPAAVCLIEYDVRIVSRLNVNLIFLSLFLLKNSIDDVIKQKITAEMNLSNTAFVAKSWNRDEDDENVTQKFANELNISENAKSNKSDVNKDITRYTLRWFTPKVEVELCGHATIAAARVLFDRDRQLLIDRNENTIHFETKYKGVLSATIDWQSNIIALQFPANPPKQIEISSWIEQVVTNILGADLSREVVTDVQYSALKILLLRLKDEEIDKREVIYKVSPNFGKLLQIDTNGTLIAVVVTQRARSHNINSGIHFLSRAFGPWLGVNEDPATGSAHTVLTSYWTKVLNEEGISFNGEIVGKQCSVRTGIVFCSLCGTDKVKLRGNTRLVLTGELKL